MRIYSPRLWKKLGKTVARGGRGISGKTSALSLRMAQRASERLHLRIRRDLLKLDEHLDSALAFSGRSE